MQVSTDPVRRRFLCLLMSGGGLLASSFVGCNSSETKTEVSEDARKAINANKIGDPSKFIKPKAGKRR